MSLLMGCVTLLPLRVVPRHLPAALAPALLVGTLVYLVQYVTLEEEPGGQPHSEGWHWGVIYHNRADPAAFVPKRLGLGYTRNMAHPLA